MSDFNNISDELLAAYLDGNCSEEETFQIEDAISAVDDLSTLLLSQSVMDKMEAEIDGLPSFEKGKVITFEPYANLRAAGFLGTQATAFLHPDNELNRDDDGQETK